MLSDDFRTMCMIIFNTVHGIIQHAIKHGQKCVSCM